MDFALLVAAGFAGLVVHWLKKWGRGEISAGFWSYMSEHRGNTVASLCSLVGYVVSLYIAGDVVISKAVLASTFMAGYVGDSLLNKAPDEKIN